MKRENPAGGGALQNCAAEALNDFTISNLVEARKHALLSLLRRLPTGLALDRSGYVLLRDHGLSRADADKAINHLLAEGRARAWTADGRVVIAEASI